VDPDCSRQTPIGAGAAGSALAAEDQRWMGEALDEARLGLGLTTPNPPVGAVVVAGGECLGRGHHRRAGGPHAEVAALADARRRLGDERAAERLRGATIYVTLEPCSTHGRTPPCTDAIMAAGLGRVVHASADPTPANAGRARSVLEPHGIEVSGGVLQAEGNRLLAPWLKWVREGLPWVIAKAGLSLDGRLTRPPGESQWITSEAARADAMGLRVRADAILVGAETVRRDNPALTLRGDPVPPDKVQPWRAVWTRSRELPPGARLFTDEHRGRTRVISENSWNRVLGVLAQMGVTTVLVEGGGRVLGDAFGARGVDEVCFYLAPRICGGGVPAVGGLEFAAGAMSCRLEQVQWTPLGDNMRVSGLPRWAEDGAG